jgi:intein/homing endonuclease
MPSVTSPLGVSSVPFDEDCRVSDWFIGPGGLQRNGRLKHAPLSVDLTEEALFVFGYFAGDGFSSSAPGKGRFISFAGHQTKKAESIARCQRWAESFGLGCHLRKERGGMGMELRAYSAEWAFWFRKHFGHGANTKRLPEFLLNLNREQSEALLSGLIASDGYCRKGRREYITGSSQLAAQVARLIIRCGYRPCIGKNSTGQFVIGFSAKGTAGLVREVKHRFPRKLNGNYEQVYGLTVEDGSSFVIGLLVVHHRHRTGRMNSVPVQQAA